MRCCPESGPETLSCWASGCLIWVIYDLVDDTADASPKEDFPHNDPLSGLTILLLQGDEFLTDGISDRFFHTDSQPRHTSLVLQLV